MNRITVLTLNLFGEQPPLPQRMALVAHGLRDLRPDVIALQEVRQVQGTLPNQAQTLGEQIGYSHCWVPTVEWGGGHEGLAILSRHPILSHEHLVLPASTPDETRIVLLAVIGTPAGAVHCYSTHLHYRLAHGIAREQQVVAIDEFVRAHPSDRPQIVMGDFNATPDHDEIRFLRGLHTLAGRRTYYQDAYARRHPNELGFTWAERNPLTARMHWLERDRRIDYIFVTPALRDGRGSIHDSRIVFDAPDSDGCFATDHFGVWAEIQLTPNEPVG